MNTLCLLLCPFVLGQAELPEKPTRISVPITDARSYGAVSTTEATRFLKELVGTSDRLCPGLVMEAIRRGGHPDTYTVIFSAQQVCYSWGAVVAVYSPQSGRLLRFGFSQLGEAKPNVTVEECLRRAKTFYELAGGRFKLGEPLVFDKGDGAIPFVNARQELLIPGEGYSVGAPIEYIFDRTFGLPTQFLMAYPPEREKAAKVIASSDAGLAAASAALRFIGWESVEVGVQQPRYAIPEFGKMPNALDDRHRRLSKEGKACLIYEVSVNDFSSYNEEEKRYERFVQAYVDAETGRVLAILPAHKMSGAVSKKSVSTSVVGREWRCGTGKGLLRVSSKTAVGEGKPVILGTGSESWLFARYDADSGLVWFVEGGVKRVFTPDQPLARALKGYRPPALAEQPIMAEPPKVGG
jgi:hypothetical protein